MQDVGQIYFRKFLLFESKSSNSKKELKTKSCTVKIICVKSLKKALELRKHKSLTS